MGPNAPSEFSRLDKYILINGTLNFDIGCTEEEVLRDICELVCSSTSSELVCSSTSSELVCSSTSSELVCSSTSSELVCSSTSSELVCSSTSSELVCSSTSSELDLPKRLPQDIEFVKCIGKMCHISQTSPGFTWNGMAVKHLCGQGDLYVRLKRDITKREESACGFGHKRK